MILRGSIHCEAQLRAQIFELRDEVERLQAVKNWGKIMGKHGDVGFPPKMDGKTMENPI
jgi:hypothetical protein